MKMSIQQLRVVEDTPEFTDVKQEELNQAIIDYAKHCHGGNLSTCCRSWYKQTKLFQAEGLRGQVLGNAMFQWAQAKIAAAN